MNYFFKYLMPQLAEYFNNNQEMLLEFIPKVVRNKYKNEIKNLNDGDEIINDKSVKIK